jgi:hypothetical protein
MCFMLVSCYVYYSTLMVTVTVPQKCKLTFTKLYKIMSQKTELFRTTIVRTSYLKYICLKYYPIEIPTLYSFHLIARIVLQLSFSGLNYK